MTPERKAELRRAADTGLGWWARAIGEALDENERLEQALRLDSPWPLTSIVARLATAAEHLLGDHGCDVHGHEGIREAVVAARQWLDAALDKDGGQ